MLDTFSGEFFDLTLSSFNNLFGKEKIIYSMRKGIEVPISKFLYELQEIEKLTNDDKTDKRKLRYILLSAANKDLRNVLASFFEVMMCWLNGGGDKLSQYYPGYYNFSQYYQQRLIIMVNGGNIITIFAKLLLNIIQTSSSYSTFTEIYDNLTKSNREFIYELENWEFNEVSESSINEEFGAPVTFNFNVKIENKYDILAYIINYLQFINSITNNEFTNTLQHLLTITTYSDFDYCLLPNKEPSTKEDTFQDKENIDGLIRDYENMLNTTKGKQGFALFRVKSYLTCNTINSEKVKTKELKQNCKNALTNRSISYDLYKRLIPQLIQKNDLNDPGLNDPRWNLCKYYVNTLLTKKNNIKEATKFNVKSTISFFANYIKSNLLSVYTGNNDFELEGLIFYLNYTTYKLNVYIREWEAGRIESSIKYSLYEKSYQYILSSFLTLDSIISTPYLLTLSASLIEYFLNNPDGFIQPVSLSVTENILDYMISEIKNTSLCKNVSVDPAKLLLVSSSDNKEYNSRIRRFLYEKLEDAAYSEVGFPDGINIIVNAIVTNNDPDAGSLNLDNNNVVTVDSLANILDGIYFNPDDEYDLKSKTTPQRMGGKKKLTRKRKNKKINKNIKYKASKKVRDKKKYKTKKNKLNKKNKNKKKLTRKY